MNFNKVIHDPSNHIYVEVGSLVDANGNRITPQQAAYLGWQLGLQHGNVTNWEIYQLSLLAKSDQARVSFWEDEGVGFVLSDYQPSNQWPK